MPTRRLIWPGHRTAMGHGRLPIIGAIGIIRTMCIIMTIGQGRTIGKKGTLAYFKVLAVQHKTFPMKAVTSAGRVACGIQYKAVLPICGVQTLLSFMIEAAPRACLTGSRASMVNISTRRAWIYLHADQTSQRGQMWRKALQPMRIYLRSAEL